MFFWLVAALQQGVDAYKKYREKNAPKLPPHFTPPSIADQPIPTPETSNMSIGHPLAAGDSSASRS
jgi:hypothetical protein